MERAVLYARVSSNDHFKTGGENLQDQLRLCRQYAQERGYTIVTELAEDERGASGATYDLPKLSEALEMARAGQYDVLVVRELDRLARDITKQYIVEQELRQSGVVVDYALYDFPDTAEGRLQKSIYAAFAEFEREKINQRMVRGRRRKVRNGEVIVHGNPPYGYRAEDVDGRRVMVVHEPEARVVKLIFRLYTEGDGENGRLSMQGIQRYLERAMIPCPGDALPKRCRKGEHSHTWKVGTICKLLQRTAYIGTWVYGKGGDSPIEVEIPALVDPETFAAARYQAKKNLKGASRNTKRHYLLQRRLTCSCGRAMTVSARNGGRLKYYFCGGKSTYDTPDGKPACRMPYFRADDVDAATWEWLENLFTDEAALLEALRNQQIQREQSTRPQRESLDAVKHLLADKEREMKKLLDLYLTDDFPKDWLTERRKRIEAEIEGFEAEKARLKAILQEQALDEERMQTILDLARYVRRGIQKAEDEYARQQWAVEKLDVRGTLTVEDGKRVLYLQSVAGEERLSIASRSIGIRR